MKILVEVTDGTKRVIVAHLLPNLLWHQEVYSKDQLQSMIVHTEPCEWCNTEYHQSFEVAKCVRFHTSGDFTTHKIKVKCCPNCGRPLEKDVEK